MADMAVTVITAAGAVMAVVNHVRHGSPDLKPRSRTALRHALIAVSMLLGPVTVATPAAAQVSVEIAIPGVSIGIYQPVYPELVLVPGYPVYYAPQVRANYFFYDGFYWVFHDDRWYMSAWYDGPWDLVDPYSVPLFVLRVPLRYYVNPPAHFHGWVLAAPPRWDLHWGPRWVQHRHGWNHWDHRFAPRAAPPPVYQRHYSGERYPRREYQHELRERHYRYQPRDATVRQHFQDRPAPRTQAQPQPAPQGRSEPPRTQAQPQLQPAPQGRNEPPRAQYPQRERNEVPRYALTPALPQAREAVVQEQQQSPRQESGREQRNPPSPQTRPAAPPEPAMQQRRQEAREEKPRPGPVQAAPQSRAPVMYEPRQSTRQDTGPREPQGRGDDRAQGRAERGRGQERGH